MSRHDTSTATSTSAAATNDDADQPFRGRGVDGISPTRCTLQDEKLKIMNLIAVNTGNDSGRHRFNNNSKLPTAAAATADANGAAAVATSLDDYKKKNVIEEGHRRIKDSEGEHSQAYDSKTSVVTKDSLSEVEASGDALEESKAPLQRRGTSITVSSVAQPTNPLVRRPRQRRQESDPGAIWVTRSGREESSSSIIEMLGDGGPGLVQVDASQQMVQTTECAPTTTPTLMALSNDDLEAEYRKRILDTAVVAESATPSEVVAKEALERQRKLAMVLVAALFLLLTAVLTWLAVTRSTRDIGVDLTGGDFTATMAPTIPGTIGPTLPQTPEEQLLPILLEKTAHLYGSKFLHPLLDSDSPQYQAYAWIVKLFDVVFERRKNVIWYTGSSNPHGMLSIKEGSYEELRVLQYYALGTFFYSTFGNNWASTHYGWVVFSGGAEDAFVEDVADHVFGISEDGTQSHPRPEESVVNNICIWKGVLCEAENSNTNAFGLSKLTLVNNKLRGTIPREVTFLAPKSWALDTSNSNNSSMTMGGLQTFIVNDNKISGTIPTEVFGTYSDTLEHLEASNNRLKGEIPDALYEATNLRILKLNDNRLSGTLSSKIGLLSNLEVLDLSNNQNLVINEVSQPIPTEIGLLTKLTALRILEGNQYSETGIFDGLPQAILSIIE